MDVQVSDHPNGSRFEIRADGEVAGQLTYHRKGGEITLLHTETDDQFRGHGLGGQLVHAALDAARDQHLAVLPYCPFVKSWIEGHADYADLVPADRRAQFGL